MDKAELVGLTLDRLLNHFRDSPESFDYSESISPTIVWQPKINLGDITSEPIVDPNNMHAIVVRWSPHYSNVTCYVFLAAPKDPLNNLSLCDTTMTSQRWFEIYRANYRKMMRLKRLIEARNSRKAQLIYLRKLTSVFPDAVDDHIK